MSGISLGTLLVLTRLIHITALRHRHPLLDLGDRGPGKAAGFADSRSGCAAVRGPEERSRCAAATRLCVTAVARAPSARSPSRSRCHVAAVVPYSVLVRVQCGHLRPVSTRGGP